MSNKNRWTRTRSVSEKKRLNHYAEVLASSQLPEREQARAFFYAEHYGMDSLNNPSGGCVVFDAPSCGDWNCVSPEHQIVVKE